MFWSMIKNNYSRRTSWHFIPLKIVRTKKTRSTKKNAFTSRSKRSAVVCILIVTRVLTSPRPCALRTRPKCRNPVRNRYEEYVTPVASSEHQYELFLDEGFEFCRRMLRRSVVASRASPSRRLLAWGAAREGVEMTRTFILFTGLSFSEKVFFSQRWKEP